MKIFKDCKFKQKCLICDKKTKGDGVLILINGTREGFNMEAKLFHVECLNLTYYKDENIIAQQLIDRM